MDRLFKTYGRLLAEIDLRFTRYLYEKINWDNRLIVIKGAKGVGKTTMILQHILRTFADKEKAVTGDWHPVTMVKVKMVKIENG